VDVDEKKFNLGCAVGIFASNEILFGDRRRLKKIEIHYSSQEIFLDNLKKLEEFSKSLGRNHYLWFDGINPTCKILYYSEMNKKEKIKIII